MTLMPIHLFPTRILTKRAQSRAKSGKNKDVVIFAWFTFQCFHIFAQTKCLSVIAPSSLKKKKNKIIINTFLCDLNKSKQVYCAFLSFYLNCFFCHNFEEWNFLKNVFLRNLIRAPRFSLNLFFHCMFFSRSKLVVKHNAICTGLWSNNDNIEPSILICTGKTHISFENNLDAARKAI